MGVVGEVLLRARPSAPLLFCVGPFAAVATPYSLLPKPPPTEAARTSLLISQLRPSLSPLATTILSTSSPSKLPTPLPPLSFPFSLTLGKKRQIAEAWAGCILVALAVVPLVQSEVAVAAEAGEAKSLVDGLALALNQATTKEPGNALSIPTWTIHVASVVEWVAAMILVWQYGEIQGNYGWKGLSWGMVPLLGGAMCACTWHFYYNAESLEMLVVMQSALTLIGNFAMWLAAFRIYKKAREKAKSI